MQLATCGSYNAALKLISLNTYERYSCDMISKKKRQKTSFVQLSFLRSRYDLVLLSLLYDNSMILQTMYDCFVMQWYFYVILVSLCSFYLKIIHSHVVCVYRTQPSIFWTIIIWSNIVSSLDDFVDFLMLS